MLFLDSFFLQGDDGGVFGFIGQGRVALGSDDPNVKGGIAFYWYSKKAEH